MHNKKLTQPLYMHIQSSRRELSISLLLESSPSPAQISHDMTVTSQPFSHRFTTNSQVSISRPTYMKYYDPTPPSRT